MERKKQRNWTLAIILAIVVTLSNVYPVTAAELFNQTALTKAEKSLANEGYTDEDRAEKGTKISTPSNAQKPEAEDDEESSDGFEEDDELEEDLAEDELVEDEKNHKNLEDDLDDVLKDKTLEDEKPENLVWVWSDKAPALMEAEEGDDLSSQFFEMTRASVCPTYEEAYNAMTAMKGELYEGMPWTNFQPYGDEGEWGKYYRFQGGQVKGASLGVGCAAFVFLLSDEAFGDLPARTIDKGGFKYEDVKVGDILRVNNSHFVIVLRVNSSGVTVAEGNYNKSVHWGRVMSKSEVLNANFIVTRYPVGYSEEQDAEEIDQSGTEGSLSWTLTKGGTLTISGKGSMPDFSESGRPDWENYGDNINQVIIKDGVESIGNYAFYKSPVMSVQIPETVKSIGRAAFGESNLMEITVPGSVKAVGDEAFYNCQGLKSATFHEGVQSIGVNAFHKCGIAYLDFPSSIISVGAGAFMECDSLVQVRFAKGEQNVSLGNDLFSKCWYLSNVTLPVNADKISSGMFTNCFAITYLYIPTGVEVDGTGLNGSPFMGCKTLKTIDFGGTESEWQTNGGKAALNAVPPNQVTVNFNVAFDDPFADIPNDPGEFVTCEHVDENGDGRCDLCDTVLSNDSTDPSDPVDPVDPDEPGDDKEEPVNPGDTEDGDKDPVKPGDSSGSSGSGSGGSSSDDSSSEDSSFESSSKKSASGADGSVNKLVSKNTTTNGAGEKVETAKWSDGTIVVMTTAATGAMRLEVELPNQTVEAAQREDKATALPIDPIQVTNDITKAIPVTVNWNREKQQDITDPTVAAEPMKLLVPVTTSGAGTVAVLVNQDGSTQIIEDSILIEGKMVVPMSDGDTVKIVDLSREFADVPADVWYKEVVNYVTARNLFHGVAETTFNPAARMTCATLVTALAELEGLDTEGETPWYKRGMSWAVTSGVMDAGVNPESTATKDLIKIFEKYFNMTIDDELPATLTRAEAAQMLWNLKSCRP